MRRASLARAHLQAGLAVATEQRALGVLCDALAPGGLPWLGEAEWPTGDLAARLAPVDRQARLLRLRECAHA